MANKAELSKQSERLSILSQLKVRKLDYWLINKKDEIIYGGGSHAFIVFLLVIAFN
ncbi:hypothetical protein LPICM02_180032 [Pseudolactococcus piscium]|nr:hypothetical protein LPICM02_180032 [Lactococcus piscium]